MTNAELIDYYVNLLIVQYKRQENAPEHIRALVETIIFLELIDAVRNGYDIDTAIGRQLDILGKYLGLQREALGLNDNDYRSYLKFKIIQNNSNSSLKEIDDLFYEFFPDEIFVNIDTGKMYIIYSFVNQDIDFVLTLIELGLIPKPAAVQLIKIIHSSNPFVFFGDPDGTGFGKLSDDDVLLLDSNGDTVQDTDGNDIFVLINTADPNDGGEFAAVIE